MKILDRPSPNCDARAAATVIDMLVLHYTGMPNGDAALTRLIDPASKVSAHYMIEEDGRVFRLVPEKRRAWHAGVSYWCGERDVNSRSIGIELVNPGHEFGYRDFPEPQMRALEALATEIVTRHRIPAANVLAHSDVAPQRKSDPGERFDWARLARAGIGLWPAGDARPNVERRTLGLGEVDPVVRETQENLAAFGYEVSTGGALDEATAKVIVAFQRHFRPRLLDGRIDGETRALARLLAAARPLTRRIADRT